MKPRRRRVVTVTVYLFDGIVAVLANISAPITLRLHAWRIVNETTGMVAQIERERIQ